MIVPLLLTEKLEDLPHKCKLTPGECWWHYFMHLICLFTFILRENFLLGKFFLDKYCYNFLTYYYVYIICDRKTLVWLKIVSCIFPF